ncbi:GNAT family N-acetyltransferase [Candidatus Soleaferrea massiliensis]|uniref:GNAT family N-acetyltransferase n=1 Tax=Candidatus Soleaferrea massiliensis TaxID=1470354 RepID=UPI00058E32CF|nr:GNAT family N-acetyltransferase [Candidatus Soleaferrea massiliensis]
MSLIIRTYTERDLPAITEIWNEIVQAADSFPGDHPLESSEAADMFASQTETACAELDGEIVGVYILHPNNIGRCAHIANASYGIKKGLRGQGIGRKLVEHSLERAKAHGFTALQFNAVVCTNTPAIKLYEDLGFERMCRVQHGYRLKDGSFADTFLFIKQLD